MLTCAFAPLVDWSITMVTSVRAANAIQRAGNRIIMIRVVMINELEYWNLVVSWIRDCTPSTSGVHNNQPCKLADAFSPAWHCCCPPHVFPSSFNVSTCARGRTWRRRKNDWWQFQLVSIDEFQTKTRMFYVDVWHMTRKGSWCKLNELLHHLWDLSKRERTGSGKQSNQD